MPLDSTPCSLGAGAAALVSLRLREHFPNLKCLAYSCPGGLVSSNLAAAMAPFCTTGEQERLSHGAGCSVGQPSPDPAAASTAPATWPPHPAAVAVGKDAVPRATVATLARLMDEASEARRASVGERAHGGWLAALRAGADACPSPPRRSLALLACSVPPSLPRSLGRWLPLWRAAGSPSSKCCSSPGGAAAARASTACSGATTRFRRSLWACCSGTMRAGEALCRRIHSRRPRRAPATC